MALLNNADEPDLELWDAAEEQVYQRQREEAADLLAQLPQQWPLPDGANPADRHDVVQRAFEAWVARERAATRQWIELCPDRATSNLPLLTVQADQSVFVSGDITKDDTYELDFTDVPAGITAVRLEVLPDARLPARGPGLTYFEGPKGDFFLGEFRVLREDQTLPISRATESYAKNHFGALPVSAQLATDGDPQTGWSCADRYGEPHQAVFVLQEPLAAAGPLRVTMRFGRHFPASLGRFRLAVTTDPRGAEARSLPREVEQVLTVEDRHWTAAQRDQVWETFLLSAPELKEPAARIHALLRRAAAADGPGGADPARASARASATNARTSARRIPAGHGGSHRGRTGLPAAAARGHAAQSTGLRPRAGVAGPSVDGPRASESPLGGALRTRTGSDGR